ncbi:hypothetical protein BKA70DRAFT_692201 [Coprinopsis sp. MPI-PUGE-AT-0042]|nr:hypothetical protein BKA70DRAFT_692201 [Coprinopsis sp. MPI-PUGE-AT-0042]
MDIPFLKSMPSLRRLRLHVMAMNVPVLPHITSLEVASSDPLFADRPLYSLHPFLTSLTLKFLSPYVLHASAIFTFQCLRTLTLVSDVDGLARLYSFDCPALERFIFELQSHKHEIDDDEYYKLASCGLMDLLGRSQGTIRSLKLSFAASKLQHNVNLSTKRSLMARDAVKFLEASLEEVGVEQWLWGPGGCVEPKDIPSLPRLHTLAIGQLSQEDGQLLLAWLQSRAEGLSPFFTEPTKTGRESSVYPRLYLASVEDRRRLPNEEVDKLMEKGLDIYVRDKEVL